ncbi:MAG: sugar nucleotide-binding protein [Candidatus Gastranaerophilales bacterium]|nr:sugar nucleotide-binding protein [Candidatus Gastranaerophilales bacterium]
MKICILGSTGLLGQALIKKAKLRRYDVVGVARKNADVNLDITNDDKLIEFISSNMFDCIINTCAYVNHDICEKEPLKAYALNSRPSSILTMLANKYNYKYVYISTDGYFHDDGRKKHDENSKISFLNEYARTKYIGEVYTLANPKSLVVRTNIVGFKGNPSQQTFVEWVISSLESQENLTLFEDYYTSSISVLQFSDILYDILIHNPCGVINIASSQVSSKKEFIEALASEFGFSLSCAQIGSIKQLKGSLRPNSLGLDVSKAENILGYKFPNLLDVIRCLKKEYVDV